MCSEISRQGLTTTLIKLQRITKLTFLVKYLHLDK